MEKKKRPTAARRALMGMLSHVTGSHVIFDMMDYGNSLLLLYHNSDHHKGVFKNLIKQKEDALVHYISHNKNRLSSDEDCAGNTFWKIDGETLREINGHMDTLLSELKNQGTEGLILADWGHGKVSECSLFLPFLEELVQRCQTKSGKQRKKRIMLVNAFDASKVGSDFISRVIGLHQRTLILQEGHSTVILPELSPSLKSASPQVRVVPQSILEKFPRRHLEPIIFSLLEMEDTSGYQILKAINHRFHSDFPQSTLYRLLQRLEKEQKITRRSGKGRRVIYSLTQEGREELQEMKRYYLEAFSYFMAFINPSGSPPAEEEGDEAQMSLGLFMTEPEPLNRRS